jgi:hypothetical protein
MPAALWRRGAAHRRAVVGESAEKQLTISVNSMAQNAVFVNLFLHTPNKLGNGTSRNIVKISTETYLRVEPLENAKKTL